MSIARIYHDKLLVRWKRSPHCDLGSLQHQNAESPNGHAILSGESEFKRTMRTDPYNETHDYGLVKDEVPDSDTHDDELVFEDDELVALELLRDHEIGLLA